MCWTLARPTGFPGVRWGVVPDAGTVATAARAAARAIADRTCRRFIFPRGRSVDRARASLLRGPRGNWRTGSRRHAAVREVGVDCGHVRGGGDRRLEFGAHLPLLSWGDERPPSLAGMTRYARTADELGFTWLAANDHVVYGRPWLDGPVALASVLPATGSMTLATTVGLPVVRGPGPFAKAMAAIDLLSGGRLVVGVGPGSSQRDYRAMGIPWDERWPRFEESVRAVRALLRPGGPAFEGAHYPTVDMELLPGPARAGGPPIWVGSWGSDAGLRRVARLADGWLA